MQTESAGRMLRPPVRPGYFADPFVVRVPDGTYAAYGTHPEPPASPSVFEVLVSDDLSSWTSRGPALTRLPDEMGGDYWAPEVCERDGAWWMYFSVGRGIHGHHIRVARADAATGPFVDQGVDLTPDETFAIDPHPFRDDDGHWYLYFARDVLEADRPGTHLAVARLDEPTAMSGTIAVLQPDADWQIYERGRSMYDAVYDWHTLEGPAVLHRRGTYWMTYSGGAWTGAGYGVSWASADHPLGPWHHAPEGTPPLLATTDQLIGPGHSSFVTASDGSDVIAFHSWNADGSAREFHLAPIEFADDGPHIRFDRKP